MAAPTRHKPITQLRALSAIVSMTIIDRGRSLDQALPEMLAKGGLDVNDAAWAREVVYGIMRRFWPLENAAGQLLDKPLRKKDRDIYFLLLVGLYQLQFMRTPEHAALSETVNGCTALGKTWAKKLVNGCLRSFLRTGISIDDSSHHYSHPDWLAEKISRAWPDYTDTILATNNVPPPMCLRINLNRVSRADYLARLSDIDIRARAR